MKISPRLHEANTLRRLLPDAKIAGDDDVSVAGCTDDARRVRTGDLFFALARRSDQLHRDLAQAIARGCAAVVSELPLADLPVPVCHVSNVRRSFGHACQIQWGQPAQKLRIVGVAGSVGKTTTACLIARILAESGHPVGMLGSLGYFDGEESVPASASTPKPPELARWLAQMQESGCSHVVLEVTDQALAREGLAGLELDALCITNTQASGKPGKRNAGPLRSLNYLADDGFVVVNSDDPLLRKRLSQIGHAALSVGIDSPAEITGTEVERHLGEETFLVTAGWETFPVQTRPVGRHHIQNCLVAAAVGLVYGVPLETVVRGLETVDTIPGRMQPVTCGQPFSVFVDAARTPHQLQTALAALRPATQGRVICVFTPGSSRPGIGKAWAEVVEPSVDLAVLTTGSQRDDFRRSTENVLRDFAEPERVRRIADRAEAIAWALNEAKENDTVLITGKGHQLWRPASDHRLRIDDYQFACQWLYQEVDLRWPLPSE